jgi:hypothetical protein
VPDFVDIQAIILPVIERNDVTAAADGVLGHGVVHAVLVGQLLERGR